MKSMDLMVFVQIVLYPAPNTNIPPHTLWKLYTFIILFKYIPIFNFHKNMMNHILASNLLKCNIKYLSVEETSQAWITMHIMMVNRIYVQDKS